MPGHTDKGSWFEAQLGLSKLRFRLRADGTLEWMSRGTPRRRVQAHAYRLADNVYHATLQGDGEQVDVVVDTLEKTLKLKQDLESGETLAITVKVRELPNRWIKP